MPNVILTPEIIARESLMVLRDNAVMAGLVHRDFSSEFVPGVGSKITVRKPATFTAKEFTGSIDLQDVSEGKVTVSMDKLLDVSFKVSSADMTLSIDDFSNRFIVPAVQAFASKIDSYLLGLQSQVTSRISAATGMNKSTIIAMRKALQDNSAPLTDRRLVLNTQAEAALLNEQLFTDAASVGDGGTALSEAALGRKFGLDVYADQNTPDGISMAFHKNAFALVTRALAVPNGNSNSSIIDYDGFGIRVTFGYDINTKSDIVSLDMLCGVAVLDEKLAAVSVETYGA